MTLLTGWPTLTDDAGDGVSGTVLDKSVFDTMKSEIENVTHSTTNTTIDPKDTTDEVVTARGNKSDLDTRISGVIDDDGALITPASLISASQLQSAIGRMNLCKNDTFLLWSGGDTAAPDYWTFVDGGTATIDRAGSGQSDTRQKVGLYTLSLTNACEMYQTIISTGAYSAFEFMETNTIQFGAWCYASIASHARLQVDDGNTTTSGTTANGGEHSGTAGWEWLTLSHTISSAGSYLRVQFDIQSNGTAYFSGATCLLGGYAPDNWVPSQKVYGMVYMPFSGTPSTGDGKGYARLARGGLIKAVTGYCKTAPAFTITAGTNDDIDITEGITGDAIATIAAGDYATGAALATAVATAINTAATDNTWTCTYSTTTGKFTIGHDNVQSGGLEWNTGASTATSAADTLGYNTDADDTGASSYVGDTDTRTELGLVVDVEIGDGASSWNSIFSAAKSLVGRGDFFGGAEPDGTYRYRCIPPGAYQSAADSDDMTTDSFAATLRYNLDTVPNSTADGYVAIEVMQYSNPLEDFLLHDDI